MAAVAGQPQRRSTLCHFRWRCAPAVAARCLHTCIAHATLHAPPIAQAKDKSANPMRDIKIEKVVLNISTGESGDKLTLAARVLEQLTGQKPVTSKGMWALPWPYIAGYKRVWLCAGAVWCCTQLLQPEGLCLASTRLDTCCIAHMPAAATLLITTARYTVRQFGIRRNEKIATHVTVCAA